jgi:hypothetical protein
MNKNSILLLLLFIISISACNKVKRKEKLDLFFLSTKDISGGAVYHWKKDQDGFSSINDILNVGLLYMDKKLRISEDRKFLIFETENFKSKIYDIQNASIVQEVPYYVDFDFNTSNQDLYYIEWAGDAFINRIGSSGSSILSEAGNYIKCVRYYQKNNSILASREGKIREINPTTGQVLSESTDIGVVKFSVYGNYIVYISNNKVCVYNLTDKVKYELPESEGAVSAAISPDYKRIAYCRYTDGYRDIVTSDLDGKNRYEITAEYIKKDNINKGGADETPFWFDEDWLTYGNGHIVLIKDRAKLKTKIIRDSEKARCFGFPIVIK